MVEIFEVSAGLIMSLKRAAGKRRCPDGRK